MINTEIATLHIDKIFWRPREKKKKETNCLISCLLISTGEHNPASNWKLTRLRQVGYRLDTSRYLLTVSRTHSSPRLDLIHHAGNYKGKKRIWKNKNRKGIERKNGSIRFFFVVDNHHVDGRGRTMHHDGQLHKQRSRRLIIELTGYPMYSISYLRFPRLWLHQFSLKKWRSVGLSVCVSDKLRIGSC